MLNDSIIEIIGRLNSIVEATDISVNDNIVENPRRLGDIREALDACERYAYTILNDSRRDDVSTHAMLQQIDLVNKDRNHNSEAFRQFCIMFDSWFAEKFRVATASEENRVETHQDDVIVYDTDDFPARKEGRDLCETRANIIAASRHPNAPLVSILVVAYNRLEKTKRCVESIIKYTMGIDCELILFDHGSTDQTFEYFRSVEHPRKKVIRVTKNATRIIQEVLNFTGKFIVVAGSDIVVTQNWLSNLIKCAESDHGIGMIVPTMSNVSNLQEVDLQFASIDEMQEKAAMYNVSNFKKWHERLRLVTPLYFIKKECFDLVGLGDYGIGQFLDDDLAFNVRRVGYKAVLCKDTFVHHDHDFRNLEDKDPIEYAKSLEKGQKDFKQKHYGVDAWDDVNNYELNMIDMVKPPVSNENVEILGIDVKCGTPILEIKNKLREFDLCTARLSALSEDPKYYLDLKTICEGDVFCGRKDHLPEYFENRRFDYVVLGTPLNTNAQPIGLLKKLLKLLKSEGQLFIRLRNTFDVCTMMNALGNDRSFYDNCPVHLTVEFIQRTIHPLNAIIRELRVESHTVGNDVATQFSEIVKNVGLAKKFDETMTRLFAENYVLNIVHTQ